MYIYKILIMFVELSEMDLEAVQNCSHPQAQKSPSLLHHPQVHTQSAHTKKDGVEDYLIT